MVGEGGKPITRQVVRHPGAVAVVPLLEGGEQRVVLIRNWRISVEKWLYEIPAGTLEKGERPEKCAARELEEETGYRAATLELLCRFYTSPGLSDELMWVYAATGLVEVGQRLEENELVTVHPVAADKALAMMDSGELVDSKSIAGLLVAQRRGLLKV